MAPNDVGSEVMKVAPPLTVSGLTLFGYSIAEWVQIATLLYIVLQVHYLLRANNKNYNKVINFVLRRKANGVDSKGK